MRRLLMMALLCALLCPMAATQVAAASEVPGPLTADELFVWRDDILAAMRGMPIENDPSLAHDPQRDRWLFAFSFGMVEMTTPDLNPVDNQIAEVELLTADIACPRGIRVGDSMGAVLAAYPNDNPLLQGDAAYAALYARDDGELMDGNGWGWLLRSGNTAECLQYAVAVPVGGMLGYRLDLSVLYVLTDGQVSTIRVTGFCDLISDEESRANLAAVRDIATRDGFVPEAYIAYLGSAEPLTAEDLRFSELDFKLSGPEDLYQILGQPLAEELDTVLGINTVEYADVLAEFYADEGGWRLNALLVTGNELAGPRGVRIGDSMDNVLSRFGGEPVDDVLYCVYVDDTGVWITLRCTFFQGVLSEYVLSRE